MNHQKKTTYLILFIVLFIFNIALASWGINPVFRIILGSALCFLVVETLERR